MAIDRNRDNLVGRGGQAIVQRGMYPMNVLNITGAVHAEYLVVGRDTYEVAVLDTDSGEDTSGGEFNNSEDPITATIAAHGLIVGDLISVQDAPVEIMRVTSVVDANTVVLARGVAGSTIGAHADAIDIYKGAASITAGRIAVGLDDAAKAVSDLAAALAVTITEDGTESLVGVDIGSDNVLMYVPGPVEDTRAIDDSNITADANAAAFYGGAKVIGQNLLLASRVPLATEVTLGELVFQFPFTPTAVFIAVDVTATGAPKGWDGAYAIGANGLVTMDNGGGTAWATTDTVKVLAIG